MRGGPHHGRRVLPAGAIRAAGFAAALVIGGCGTNPTPAPDQVASVSPSVGPTASASAGLQPASSPSPPPSASPSPSATLSADLTTRPFTVLILGGDNGFRTDAMMVAGLDPIAKTLSMASIPRDTVNVPLPGGGVFAGQKINAFYDFAASHPGAYPQGPGRATADLVGTLLGIHIDFYAGTSFDGFVRIVEAIGGVKVNLARAVVDPYYQVSPTSVGVRFPAGAQTLKGERALVFVRTRQGDNDFARQRRQQLFLLAAGQKLLSNPRLLVALARSQGSLITDFPLGQLAALVSDVRAIDPRKVRQLVLGPTRYESAASCTCGYALAPRLREMRAAAKWLFPWAVQGGSKPSPPPPAPRPVAWPSRSVGV